MLDCTVDQSDVVCCVFQTYGCFRVMVSHVGLWLLLWRIVVLINYCGGLWVYRRMGIAA